MRIGGFPYVGIHLHAPWLPEIALAHANGPSGPLGEEGARQAGEHGCDCKKENGLLHVSDPVIYWSFF
jgi:hypothetical protein